MSPKSIDPIVISDLGCMACTTERPADVGAVAAELEQVEEKPKEELKTHLDAYKQLENLDIIPNAETFECTICYLDVEPGDGVMLRECLHTFCKYEILQVRTVILTNNFQSLLGCINRTQ